MGNGRRSVTFVVPGRLDTRTGGYEYDRRMIAGLRERGWSIDVREIDGRFPRPTPAELDEAGRVLASLPDRATVLIDGLALGAMPCVVEPGTEPAALARGSQGGPLELLCVATLSQGKGHDMLLDALAKVPFTHWHLTCAGHLDRHPETVRQLRARMRDDDLEARVSLIGDVDATTLAACYDRADLFVLATRHETYGMAVAEALSRGLPVVSTATGAIPVLVGEDAGLIVPVGDAAALAGALARVISEPQLRARLTEGARRARHRLPTWDSAAAAMAAALERVTIDV